MLTDYARAVATVRRNAKNKAKLVERVKGGNYDRRGGKKINLNGSAKRRKSPKVSGLSIGETGTPIEKNEGS